MRNFNVILGENTQIAIAMSRQNIQSRFIVEFDEIKLLIDTPNNTIQGFVVNVDCHRFERIFDEGDHSIIFRDNNFWLFIDDNIDLDEIDTRVSTDFERKKDFFYSSIDLFSDIFKRKIDE